MGSEIMQVTKAYRHLLKAIKNHIGKEDYKVHFTEYVMQEFRKNVKLSDPSSIQQKIKLARDYTFLLNNVHHHKLEDKVLVAGFGRKVQAVGDIPGVRFKVVKVAGVPLLTLF